MAKYIEREALLDSLRESQKALREIAKGLRFPVEKQICDAQIITFSECILRVKDAPTLDVEPVVRCKDCKHNKYVQPGNNIVHCKRNDKDGLIFRKLNDYCSYGERRCSDG